MPVDEGVDPTGRLEGVLVAAETEAEGFGVESKLMHAALDEVPERGPVGMKSPPRCRRAGARDVCRVRLGHIPVVRETTLPRGAGW